MKRENMKESDDTVENELDTDGQDCENSLMVQFHNLNMFA